MSQAVEQRIGFDDFVRSITEEYSSDKYLTIVGLRRLASKTQRQRESWLHTRSPTEITLVVHNNPFSAEIEDPVIVQSNPKMLYLWSCETAKIIMHRHNGLQYGILSPKGVSLEHTIARARLLPSCTSSEFVTKKVQYHEIDALQQPFENVDERKPFKAYCKEYEQASNRAYQLLTAMLSPLPYQRYRSAAKGTIPDEHRLKVLSLLEDA